jgi:hypothetical protein
MADHAKFGIDTVIVMPLTDRIEQSCAPAGGKLIARGVNRARC